MKIKTQSQLRELYGHPSGRAKDKVFDTLDPHAINFIEHSPFLVMSTCSKTGSMDASPRGGQAGFVKVLNSKEIVIPDSKGNNRMDSISNLLENGFIGMLFLIPGIDETLRLNGKAHLTTEPSVLALFSEDKNPPKTCIVITVNEVFLHCAKALMRSKLWSDETKIERSAFPTMGRMLKDQLGGVGKMESQEEMVKRYEKDL